MHFLNLIVHPTLNRQEIAGLDSLHILVRACKKDLLCALQTFQSGGGQIFTKLNFGTFNIYQDIDIM